MGGEIRVVKKDGQELQCNCTWFWIHLQMALNNIVKNILQSSVVVLLALHGNMGRLIMPRSSANGRSFFESSKIALDGGGKNGEPKQTIGCMTERVVETGSFGIVFQAKCLETGETMAIKKVLQNRRDKNKERRQLMRVIDMLTHPLQNSLML
ncbi:hypothetical protein ABKV19_000985 [Rosa sericea]